MEPQKQFKRRGTPDCPISISHWHTKPRRPDTPHYHPEVEIVWVRTGQVLYWANGREYAMTEGDILFLSPNQPHCHIESTVGSNTWYLAFSLDLFTIREDHVFQKEFVQPLQDGLLYLPQFMQKGHPAYEQVALALSWLDYCETMLMPNYKALRYGMAVSLCAALLPWCTQPEIPHSTVNSNNSVVQRVMSFIRRNYTQPLTLQTIADQVHLHPNYLCALFKKHTGQTVMYHLDRTRLDTALFLLEKSQLTMTQIAERSGYRSEYVFYHKFKRLTGSTPTQHRRTHSTR